jgi:hypothetical protein
MPVRSSGRKLLVASIGVATVTYAACTAGTTNPGVPQTGDASSADGTADARDVGTSDAFVTSGNLVAPIPDASDSGKDAATDANAADAPDGG